MKGLCTSSYRVLYCDADPMGVVYHANYLKLAELGRNDFCRQCGMSYRDVEAAGFILPVVDTRVKYLRPAKFDDLLEIRTWVARRTRVRLEFQFEILRDEQVLVYGNTVLASLTREGRPVKLPPEMEAGIPVAGPKDGLPFGG